MESPLDALADRELDALVLGGGLTGAAVARELAGRGARVALVEPVDFGWGASGRSARLALAAAPAETWTQPRLLRALLNERLILARATRQLVRPVPLVTTPAAGRGWSSRWERAREHVAAALFRRRGWPAPRTISQRQLQVLLPGFALARPGPVRVQFDAVFDDRRAALLTALAARRCGALLAPRCDVTGLEQAAPGGAWAELRDRITGQTIVARARAVINATGPWIDQTRRMFDVGRGRPLFHLGAAVRLAAARSIDGAVVLRHPRDGRRIAITPTFGGLLVSAVPSSGRRARSAENPDDDAAYLEEALLCAFPGEVVPVRARVRSTHVLVRRPGLVRESGPGGVFWSVVSGSPILHRLAGREVAERLADLIGPFAGRGSASSDFLPGGDIAGIAGEEAAARAHGLSALAARWMVGRYGSLWKDALAEGAGAEPLVAGGIPLRCEIGWAVRQEEARTLSDVMLRWRVPEIAGSPEHESAIARAAEDELAALAQWTGGRRERERARWERERNQVYGGGEPRSEP